MPSAIARLPLIASVLSLALGAGATAQTPPSKQPVMITEPGLEAAAKWKWTVQPSGDDTWGLPLPEAPAPAITAGSLPQAHASLPGVRPDTYEVKRGDALYNIARKFRITVDQLKVFNNLTATMIHIGDVLKIPTPEEAAAITPPPPAVPKKAPKNKAATKNTAAPVQNEFQSVPLQVYLDREGFSAGPINQNPALIFGKVLQLYQDSHDEKDLGVLQQKAQAALGDGFTHYTLKEEDFRFIAPPRAQRPDAASSPHPAHSSHKSRAAKIVIKPMTFQELTQLPMLTYRTPWAFVAERFHCDEELLRLLNPQIRSAPVAGADFKVPNVVPFEIERAFHEPFQPQADPQAPMTASLVDRSLLEVYRSGTLIAVMPVSAARPGLRGRGTWTVLNVIPHPRLMTRREPKDPPVVVKFLFGSGNPEATPTPAPTPLPAPEYLAPGPRNPVGIIWINLAKAGSNETVPYGLHGTSIPDRMFTEYSIGGFRLTNWDIDRTARLLPVGTPLEWKQSTPIPVAPAQPAPAPQAQPVIPAQPSIPAAEAAPSTTPVVPQAPPASPQESPL